MSVAAEDTEIERQHWHWRTSMRPVRFFNLDARAALPFFILLFHFRITTLVLTVFITIIFHVLEHFGLPFPCALRSLRVWIVGYNRPAWVSARHRKLKDFG